MSELISWQLEALEQLKEWKEITLKLWYGSWKTFFWKHIQKYHPELYDKYYKDVTEKNNF